MSFKKILCPVDFSPGSRQAMRVAVRLANGFDAELVLAHVWYLPATAFAGESSYPAEAVQAFCDDAKRGLDAALGEAKSFGAKRVTAELLRGIPWHAIVDAADDPQIDLIVVGTHGRTGLARVLLGSVAEKVIRHAPCSVLAVHPADEPGSFNHILCPTDFTEPARHATELASGLANPGGAGITLLHVLELPVAYSGDAFSPDFYRDLDRRSAALLDEWATELKGRVSVPVATRSRLGSPGSETLATLDDDRTLDLVVMGSHGRTGIKRAFLGSVAEKVVRHARCPVLVARRRG